MMDLSAAGIFKTASVRRNLSPAELVETAIQRGEGILASNGALMVSTGERTGRSPKDKFVVRQSPSSVDI